MDHNSSSSSDPFDEQLFIDDELLQQLVHGLPPTPDLHDDHQTFVAPPMVSGSDMNTNDIQEGPSQQNASAHVKGKSSSKKSTEKSKAVDVERRRRQEMAALHRSLRSHLPAEYIRGKRSISDHLQEAVRYVKDLEGGIKELSLKRDELMMTKSAGSSSGGSNNSTAGSNQENVTVKSCKDGLIDIIVSTCNTLQDDEGNQYSNLPLSKVLHILGREGLNVINCVSSSVGNNMIHSIQVQVDDGRDIDLCLLQHKLTGQL